MKIVEISGARLTEVPSTSFSIQFLTPRGMWVPTSRAADCIVAGRMARLDVQNDPPRGAGVPGTPSFLTAAAPGKDPHNTGPA